MQYSTGEESAGIAARMACDLCLRAPSSIRVTGGPGLREAACECGHCRRQQRFALSGAEAASLWSAVPRPAHVSWASEAI